MDPQATAGRVVHYTDATERSVAAVVCVDAGPDGIAALMTLFPGKPPVPMSAVPYSEEPAKGCWNWMPYQKAKAEQAGGNQSESAEPRPAELQDRVDGNVRAYDILSVETNDLRERVWLLEQAGQKEAMAAKAAEPERVEPQRTADISSVHGGYSASEGANAEVPGPLETLAEVANAELPEKESEPTVVTEPGPPAPDEDGRVPLRKRSDLSEI